MEDSNSESLFTRIKALLGKKQHHDDRQLDDIHQAVEEVATFCGEQVDQLRTELSELKTQHQQLQTDHSTLKTALEQQPSTPPRQPTTGGNADMKTDC